MNELIGPLGLPGALVALVTAAYIGVRLWQSLQARQPPSNGGAVAAHLQGGFQVRVEERLGQLGHILENQITEGRENRMVLVRLTEVLDQVSARLTTHDQNTAAAVGKVDAIYDAVMKPAPLRRHK